MNNHKDKEMLVSQILEHIEQLIKKFYMFKNLTN